MREIDQLFNFYQGLQQICDNFGISEIELRPGYDNEEDMYYINYSPMLDVHEDLSLIFIKEGLDYSLCESCAQIIHSDILYKKSDSFEDFIQKLPDNQFSQYFLAQKLDKNLENKQHIIKRKI